MNGFFLLTYIVLWGLVLFLGYLCLGLLQQVGLLRQQLRAQPDAAASDSQEPPPIDQDGPAIGDILPDLTLPSMNGFGNVNLAHDDGTALVIFLSATCETCQHMIGPINALAASAERIDQTVVIMRADEQACRAFVKLFPLQVPVVCDNTRTITMGFDVHNNPFALLYNTDSRLQRKGLLVEPDDLRALLGDVAIAPTAGRYLFPPAVPAEMLATVSE